MYPKLLVADSKNRIFDLDNVAAAGMKALDFYPLSPGELIPLPYASELFTLPDRIAVGFVGAARRAAPTPITHFNGSKCFPVAAFVSPGYTAVYSAAYKQTKESKLLPLFSYAAVCWYKGRLYTAAVRVDYERRQDLRLMDTKLMRVNIAKFKKLFPKNRLIEHLSVCASVYGCPAGTNFFLKRYECPLPASPSCNSTCIGCITTKHSKTCPQVQPRIKFVPTPHEIAEVALYHIEAVKKPVVSFGQGCEGEPLMVSNVLEEAIKLIRSRTKKGIINLNTNASKPKNIYRLRKAGLDSIRVSVNSIRKKYYDIYYKPRDYSFRDVVSSINTMKKSGGFVSINYLVMPGFTDQKEEIAGLFNFIKSTKIDMIQWRNLNYDPVDYFRKMKIGVGAYCNTPLRRGIRQLIEQTKRRFPKLRHGYFNPSEI